MVVGGQYWVHGGAVFDVEDGVEAIRADLVGTHQAEVARVGVAHEHVAKIDAKLAGRFRVGRGGCRDVDGVVVVGGEVERFE